MSSKDAEFLITLGSEADIERESRRGGLFSRSEPRVAMVGRSNVGKSSLINSLLGTRLARVSNQPGKTRCAHFYLWKKRGWIVCDLPGYGFANVPRAERDRWGEFIRKYLESDPGLARILLLLDSRHSPGDLDGLAAKYLDEARPNVRIETIWTKVDSLKKQSEVSARRKVAQAEIAALSSRLGQGMWVSSKNGRGIAELSASFIDEGKGKS